MEKNISANDFCRFIWKSYLEDRRYDLISEFISDKISIIGTGAHEVEKNLQEFIEKIEQESLEWNGRFIIRDQWYQTTELSDTNSLVMGELAVREDADAGILYDMCFRFTIVLEKSDNGWRIVHIHQSVADPNQASDEFFPHHMVEQTYTQIVYNLRHDSLTGLLNRLYFKETCERFLAAGECGAFLMIDIDMFKSINDKYGHPIGDKTLISISESLKSVITPNALAGRVGGDEFTLFLPGINNIREIEGFFATLIMDWEERQKALQMREQVSISVGVTFVAYPNISYEAILNKADQALYLAKTNKNNGLVHWEVLQKSKEGN